MRGAALITGGARRIGGQIVSALAARGYDIALHYNHSVQEAQRLAEQVRQTGVRCELFQCDLSVADEAFALAPRVFKSFDHCNVLINNASVFERASFGETTEALFDRQFDINFKAPFFLSREFASRCAAGNIINILDTKIAADLTQYFVYSLTKKALADFTRLAAKELAPAIRVNGVCPGLILPPEGRGREYMDKLARKVPLKRTGSPQAVASAVVYLLENDYITGEFLFVDGGEHLL